MGRGNEIHLGKPLKDIMNHHGASQMEPLFTCTQEPTGPSRNAFIESHNHIVRIMALINSTLVEKELTFSRNSLDFPQR